MKIKNIFMLLIISSNACAVVSAPKTHENNLPMFLNVKGVVMCVPFKEDGVLVGCTKFDGFHSEKISIQEYFEKHKPEASSEIIGITLDYSSYRFFIYYK